jgi:D-3-phosphoglycerate dehydrogenase / 2-oxoglutarate reductase
MSVMNRRVVWVNPHPGDALAIERGILRENGVELAPVNVSNDDELIAVAADADVLVPAWYQASARVIGNLSRCRLIPSGGIGFDHIDAEAATEHGILVTNMAETFVEEVANQAWMLLLVLARRGLWLHEMATANRWEEVVDQLFPVLKLSMPRVTGQTLGLVPFGRIPRAMAKRAYGFGMSVVAYDPYVSAEVFREQGVEQVSLDEVFRRSDFVSCHLPLSKETFHLIGDVQFRQMKPSAIFISTGRGKVVDEPALIAALQEGRIAGAGLDVLEQEPPDPANPLLKMPNVVVSPHMASVSDVSEVERRRLIAHQIVDALNGKVPHGVVNPQAIPRWRGAKG